MDILMYILLAFLVFCAIAVSFSKNLLNSIIIFMSYSLIMSIIWVLLQSPDLAITEAAVGAGITSILFFVTLKKIKVMDQMAKSEERVKRESLQDAVEDIMTEDDDARTVNERKSKNE